MPGRTLSWLRGLVVLIGVNLLSSALMAAPTFTADQSAIILPPGKTAGATTLIVSGTGLPANFSHALAVEDVGSGPPEIRYTARLIDSGADYGLWRVDGTISGLAADSVQTRRLLIKLPGASGSIPLTVKNTPAGDFTWAVEGLAADSKRVWTVKDVIHFLVQVGPVPAHNVHLVQPDLVSTSGDVLQPAFQLCRKDGPCDGKPLTLASNMSHALELRPTSASADIGQYSGKLVLVSDENPLGDALPLTLIVGNDLRKGFGVLLLVVGTIAAFLLTQGLRARIARAQAKRPAALLRERTKSLQEDIKALATNSAATLTHASVLATISAKRLDENALRKAGFIPSRLPIYYAPTTPAASGETYESLLTDVTEKLNSIAYVLNDGVREVLAFSAAGNHKDLVKTTVEGLDELLTSTVEPNTQLFESVRDKVKAYKDAISTLRDAGDVDNPLLRSGRRDLSVREIDSQLMELNVIGWASFAILSVLIGFIVLIAPKPAFGSWQDLILCALWGFGMPTAGQQLTALGSSSAATSLGVNLLR